MTPKESAKVIFGVLHDDWFSWTPEVVEAFNMAIAALEFKERYDQFWEEVKTAGKSGKETEIHHSGSVFRIREVAQ